MEFEPSTKWRHLPLFSFFQASLLEDLKIRSLFCLFPKEISLIQKRGSLLKKIRYAVSLDIFFANAKAIGISIIASAIAKAQEMFATMFVTPGNVANMAPAPIIKKML